MVKVVTNTDAFILDDVHVGLTLSVELNIHPVFVLHRAYSILKLCIPNIFSVCTVILNVDAETSMQLTFAGAIGFELLLPYKSSLFPFILAPTTKEACSAWLTSTTKELFDILETLSLDVEIEEVDISEMTPLPVTKRDS